jgi:hypothetical protein
VTALHADVMEAAGPFERLCALLEMVDDAHAGESGSIVFAGGSQGIILVQSGRICWAASPAIAARLSHRLRRNTPVDESQLAAAFRECRESGQPFGQTLVARGIVTFDALRTALLQHIAETLIHFADQPSPRWMPGHVDHYDSDLTFRSIELLTHAADIRWGPLAAEARSELAAALGNRGAIGLAFLRDAAAPDVLVPVGVVGAGELSAREVLAAGRAAAARIRYGDPLGAHLITGTSPDGRTSVVWLDRGACYVAISAERSEIAFIVAHLSRRSSE